MEGKDGFAKLVTKVRVGGPTVLYHGAIAASAATFVGHYPWCVPGPRPLPAPGAAMRALWGPPHLCVPGQQNGAALRAD